MNIVYHHRTQGKGVEGVHINGVVQGLRALGHQVTILSLPGSNPEVQNPAKTSNGRRNGGLWSGVSQYAPERLFETLELLYNGYGWWNLNRHLRTHHTDCLYERYALFSMAGMLQAAQHGLPFILEVNDAADLPRVRPLKAKKLAMKIEQWVFQAADSIVTISQPFKQYIIERHGIPDKKITVLSNATDPDRFSPQPSTHTLKKELRIHGCVTIGFIGSFAPWHGVDLLIKAFGQIATRHPLIRLLLVGHGPELPRIKRMIDLGQLTKQVIIVGPQPYAKIHKYVDVMDIAVMPDSNTYGSPMKIFEYLAMAKPVIAPSYEPLQEVLQHRKTALLFSPRDLDGLTCAVTELIQNEQLRSELGQAGRLRIENKHNWTQYARSLFHIYESIMKNRSGQVTERGDS